MSRASRIRFGSGGETSRGRRRRAPRLVPGVEAMEGRALLSGLGPALPGPRAAVAALRLGDLGGTVVAPDAGRAAILNALRGGAGSEFVTLIRRQVRNLNAVLAGFIAGTRNEFAIKGFAVKTPKFQELYTGPRLDQLSATAAGAVLLGPSGLATPVLLHGVELWIDPAGPVLWLPVGSDQRGASELTLPIPQAPELVGTRLAAQFCWLGPAAPPPCPSLGVSATSGLLVTIQP